MTTALEIFETLTDNEKLVLKALFFNHYGDKGDGVWSWAVDESNHKSGLPKTSIPGVVGSLVKKGLYRSEEYDKNEWVLWTTELGNEIMVLLKFSYEER